MHHNTPEYRYLLEHDELLKKIKKAKKKAIKMLNKYGYYSHAHAKVLKKVVKLDLELYKLEEENEIY